MAKLTDMCQRDGTRNIKAALILFLDRDVWRLLVDSNTETLQFILDYPLIREWLVDIKNNEDQMACLGDGDNLSTSTSTVLCTLNNTRQVNNL